MLILQCCNEHILLHPELDTSATRHPETTLSQQWSEHSLASQLTQTNEKFSQNCESENTTTRELDISTVLYRLRETTSSQQSPTSCEKQIQQILRIMSGGNCNIRHTKNAASLNWTWNNSLPRKPKAREPGIMFLETAYRERQTSIPNLQNEK